MKIPGMLAGRSRVLLLALSVAAGSTSFACGDDGSGNGTGGQGADGSGGGSGGDLQPGTGGGAATGGGPATGGAGTGDIPTDPEAYPPVTCDALPAACPTNAVTGDFMVTDSESAEALRGVTSVTGDIDIEWTGDLTVYDCLEEVLSGGITIGEFGELAGTFPLLHDVGSLTIERAGSLDCAFRSADDFGTVDITNGSGELNLSTLTTWYAFWIQRTSLARIILPNSTERGTEQLWFRNNKQLRQIEGFENTFVDTGHNWENADVWIEGNSNLPECTAERIGQPYLDAGAPATAVVIQGNGDACL